MGWFAKSKDKLEREKQLIQADEERKNLRREQDLFAQRTVYQYADELKFPTRDVDVRFYNHLFSILIEHKNRITELEKQLKEKKDV
jgi:hypothetical protein